MDYRMKNACERPTHSVASLFAWTLLIAAVLSVPRFLTGVHLHWTSYLWFVLIHQVGLASAFATTVWMCTGRRRLVAWMFSLLILSIWGPHGVITLERTLSRNVTCEKLLYSTGVMPYYVCFYRGASQGLGYNFAALLHLRTVQP